MKMGRGDVIIEKCQEIRATRVVELGLWDGRTSRYVLTRYPHIEQYIGIDQFRHGPNDEITGWKQENHNGHFVTCRELAWAEPRFCLIVGDTAKSARFFNGDFDLVFIDADHSTEAVTKDIEAWWPRICSDGWLLGHDINWASVATAVRALFPGPDLQLFQDNVWGVQK